MNLRQKNKKLKRELEWYKKQMVPTIHVGTPYVIRTLFASQVYSKSHMDCLYSTNPEGLAERVREDIIDAMSDSLEDYIHFTGVDHADMPDTYEIIGELKVVVPDGGDGF